MKKENKVPDPLTGSKELRRKAEKIVLEKTLLEYMDTISQAEVKEILHELRVHQIELEMQNEELRAAQEALEVSHARYMDLYDFAPVGYITLSPEGLILEANLAAATLWGESRRELINRHIEGFIFKEDQDIYYLHRKKLFESGDPQECELRMVNKEGLPFWVWCNAIAVMDGAVPSACRMVVKEINDRKSIEKELFFKESIINSSSCAIAACDLQGSMIYGNPFFQKLWGFHGPEEFLGKPFRQFWLLGDQDENIMNALQARETWTGELKAIRKDSTLFDVQVSAATVLDNKGNPIALTATTMDITEQKRVEFQLQQLKKVKSLGLMAGAIAHHFNNQLSVIMGNLELVLEDLPEDSKNCQNLLYAMIASHKAAAVSQQMLSYLGQTSSRHKPIDLSNACRPSLLLLQAAIPKGIILNVDFPDSGPVISSNVGQIQQIITHLVTNAWESIPGNQGTISLAIKTIADGDIPKTQRIPFDWQPQNISYACLEVCDTGCGIASKDMDNLFDPFYTTNFIGRGMGLPVIRGIVKSHGGCITVDSKPCCGSCFCIYLPIST